MVPSNQLPSFRKIGCPGGSQHHCTLRNLPLRFPFAALVVFRASTPPYSGDVRCRCRTDGFGPKTSLDGIAEQSRPSVYKSQIPVIEQAIETAALMLGTDKSRGYCLEMICADFLAGAHFDNGNPEILLNSISPYYRFLPGEQQQAFLEKLREKAS